MRLSLSLSVSLNFRLFRLFRLPKRIRKIILLTRTSGCTQNLSIKLEARLAQNIVLAVGSVWMTNLDTFIIHLARLSDSCAWTSRARHVARSSPRVKCRCIDIGWTSGWTLCYNGSIWLLSSIQWVYYGWFSACELHNSVLQTRPPQVTFLQRQTFCPNLLVDKKVLISKDRPKLLPL